MKSLSNRIKIIKYSHRITSWSRRFLWGILIILVSSIFSVAADRTEKTLLNIEVWQYAWSVLYKFEWWHVILIVFIIFLYWLDKQLDKKQIATSESISERMRTNVRAVIQSMAEALGKELNFAADVDKGDRVTIYYIDPAKDNFARGLARHSENPIYDRLKDGNKNYDIKGSMKVAWEKGWDFKDKIPCPEKQPRAFFKFYEKNISKYSITPEMLEKTKMKSRLYAVARCSYNGQKYGVIVVESKNEKRFEEKKIKNKIEKYASLIAPFMSIIEIDYEEYLEWEVTGKTK